MPLLPRLPALPQPGRGRALTIATAGVLVVGLGASLGTSPSVASDRDGAAQRTGFDTTSAKGYRGRNQTSDGKPGTVVGPPVSFRGRAAQVKNDVSYEIAPGVVVASCDCTFLTERWDGGTEDAPLRFSMTLVRGTDGGWRIAEQHMSYTPAASR